MNQRKQNFKALSQNKDAYYTKFKDMKKIFVLVAVLPLFFISCGGNTQEDSEDTANSGDSLALDFSDMNEISLKENGLNMKLMLPSVASSTGNSISAQIEHDEGDYLWYVNIGAHFQLVIEDFGKEKDKVPAEKKRLKELSNIFDFEYLLDDPTLIMYKRTLHEGQGGKTSYHCFGEVIIGGYTYILRSEQEGSLKPIIEDMVKTIQSASEIVSA